MTQQRFDDHLWKPFADGDYRTCLERCAKQLDVTRAADAIHIGGLALVKMQAIDEGIKWLEASLTLMKAAPYWYENAANALAEKKRYADAVEMLEKGLRYYPNDFRLNYVRCVMFSFQGRHEESLEMLERLERLYPNADEIKLTRGYALHMLNRFEEALESYDKIKDLPPLQQEELDNNYNGIFMDMGQFQRAYDIVTEKYLETKSSVTIYNRSLIELGLGKWPQAWYDHLHRPCIGMPAHFKRPSKLMDLHGKDLFFFGEQGIGDCIQFVRFAPIIHEYCQRMTVGVPSPLIRLFSHLPSKKKFDLLPSGSTLTHFDVAMPFLDAPAILDLRVEDIPSQTPYFQLPKNVLPKWIRKDARPHVGLVWHGASRKDDARAMSIDKRRSIPFPIIEPLLKLRDHIVFVNLQLEEHVEGKMLNVLKNDFDMLETALIVNQLDLVVTIDSSVAHLAGALNKPVWMLSRFDSCWRWFWDGSETTRWYPSMRIFRQPAHHTWELVVDRVKNELEKLFP